MKKMITAALITLMTIGALAGCGNTAGNATNNTTGNTAGSASQNTTANSAVNTETNSADNSAATTPANSSDANTTDIGSDEASAIALEAAGFAESDVTNLYVSRDFDDGRVVYEVQFWKDNTEYDYEILASTGEIISYDMDVKNNKNGQGNTQNTQNGQSNTEITLEEAKQLALDRVPGATEQNMKIELDYDDGYYKYEGEIIYDQKEYDFEIDANTGTFLEWSEERW